MLVQARPVRTLRSGSLGRERLEERAGLVRERADALRPQVTDQPVRDRSKPQQAVARLTRAREVVAVAREPNELALPSQATEQAEELFALVDRAAVVALGVLDKQ